MFLLKSTHKLILDSKEAEVRALREEIAWLRNFVQPVNKNKSFLLSTEANAVLDGHQEIITLDEESLQRSDDVIRERDRLLAGTY